MKQLQEQLTHDDGSPFGRVIRLYWDPNKQPLRWIDFEIYEAVGRESVADNSAPIYYATESRELVDGVTPDLDAAFSDVHGFVKYDGCTQVYIAEDGLHYDDRKGLAGMLVAIVKAQARCYEIMAIDDQ